MPTFYDMVFRGGGLCVYYVIRGEGMSDFTLLTTIRLEEYKNTKKATTLMNSPILIDSLCTYCTRWLLKIGRVAGFLVPDLLRSCFTYFSSLELPVFFYEHIVDPTALRDVLHLSVVEFSNILGNRWMLASELSRPEYGLYFRPHNDCIEFLLQILGKIYDHSPNDAKQKRRTYSSSSLNLIVLLPQTDYI